MEVSPPLDLRARFELARPGFTLDVDLALPSSGVTALFGPSGAGKSSLLRCLAGLERPRLGHLCFRGQVWHDSARGVLVPTHRRRLGYVFQEPSLFPHLSVRQNLAYAQRRSGADAGAPLAPLVALLGIEHLLDRSPERLSGGERQRVAIARALASSPQLLLLDEPLAAVDAARRDELLPFLDRLRDELALPIVYVSHSLDELARIADCMVLLEGGRAVAQGALAEVLARLDLPTALSDDAGAVLEATVAQHDEGDCLTRLDFAGGSLWVARRPEPLGRRLRVRVHARDVSVSLTRAEDTSIINVLPATVAQVADGASPAHVLVRLDAGGAPLLARVTRRSLRALGLAPGLRLWAQVKAVALLG